MRLLPMASSLAAAHRVAGRIAEARTCLERSLALRRAVGDDEGVAETLGELTRLGASDGERI